jgi:hypothetical protein
VIKVGGVEEDKNLNSEIDKLPIAQTDAGYAVKRPRRN